MGHGYNGKILRVDLTHGAVSIEEQSEELYRHYIGGRGFISYVLLREIAGGTDPLGPENKLIFATGALTGLPVSGSGRNSVGAKSPLTGIYGDAEVGGYWGAELKHAGYDAIIIEGKSATPVYLWIQDGKAELRDAQHLWGKAPVECEQLIREELGDKGIRVAQIGAAGENLVRYACVINDISHAAGRTGLGAVMGSKKLKAIAVRGHQKVEIADIKGFSASVQRFREALKNDRFASSLSRNGTAGVLKALNTAGGLPTRNFQQGHFEGAEKITHTAMNSGLLVGRRGCYACLVRCKPEVASSTPYNINPAYGGPEYEALASLGSNCGVDNLAAVARANEMCNAAGLDVISAGVSIAFAMECFERGILTEKDTGGLRLNFGNAEAVLRLLELIIHREGLGDVLAEGTARASRIFGKGAEEFAIHVKGQELPMHEPRYKPGLGVGYTISPTGADHCHNIHDTAYEKSIPDHLKSMDNLGPVALRELGPAKIKLLVYGSQWQHVLNCLVFCQFVQVPASLLVELVNNVTGWDANLTEMMKVGERCVAMTRVFDVREGITPADDHLPQRFFTPFTSGPLAGVALDEDKVRQATETYYDMVGWDRTSGCPSPVKLQELGIGWAAGLASEAMRRVL